MISRIFMTWEKERVSFNWDKIKRVLKRWEYHLGVWGIILTVALAVAVVYYWEFVNKLGGYGYLGAFVISILGGATVIVPVPMIMVLFALGGVMKPSFGPWFGPVFIGLAAGVGETIGALSVYMTGYGGGTALVNLDRGKFKSLYSGVLRWVERRGSLILFITSATLFNPFFYPASLAAGAMRFGIRRYILICLGGKTLKGMTIAFAGYWGLRGLLRMLGMPI